MATQAPPELETQYRLLRERAGFLEQAGGHVVVSGPDAVDFLQDQVSNDVAALEPGLGCQALLLNPKGRILADLRVLMLDPQELRIDTDNGALETVVASLTMYKSGRQVDVAEDSGRRTIALIGPRAREVSPLRPPEREHALVRGELGGADLIAVTTATGVDLLYAGDLAALEDAIRARGAEPVSAEAAEVIRIEQGRPAHGLDMSADNLPGELGLEQRAVSFTKGCYVGQEPVARMHHRGHPNRLLRGLRLADPVEPGTPLLAGERQIGAVTSACVSPALGPIALALVRREVDPGAAVSTGDGGGRATVVELPFERDE